MGTVDNSAPGHSEGARREDAGPLLGRWVYSIRASVGRPALGSARPALGFADPHSGLRDARLSWTTRAWVCAILADGAGAFPISMSAEGIQGFQRLASMSAD
ncbi:hypothetical protein GCM10010411_81410 [Actinomadura fulvescens]|uniref:Uncharacterized protein n=1 Tax=Actinomadura fulvescens TaxID=46160 RepID=A0ABN3QNN0_9ACTN